jgi:hypothetical protein
MLVHPNRPHQRQAPPPAGALCPPRRHAANADFHSANRPPVWREDVLPAAMRPVWQGIVVVVRHVCYRLAGARRFEPLPFELHGYEPPPTLLASRSPAGVIRNKDEQSALPAPVPGGRRHSFAPSACSAMFGGDPGKAMFSQSGDNYRPRKSALTPGGGNWTRNLKQGEPVRIRPRGRGLLARPDLAQDPADVARLLAVMAEGKSGPAAFHPPKALTGASGRPPSSGPHGTGSASCAGTPKHRWLRPPDRPGAPA